MDKELYLITEFNKAPQYLKDAVNAHKANSTKYQAALKRGGFKK